MSAHHSNRLLFLAVLAFVLSSCGKQNAVEELEKSAAAMDKAATPADPAADPSTAALTPAQQVKEAITDLKAGKMEDSVTRLQLLRAQPALTPEQRMALQDSMAAVMTEIYTLAEKGDARALAAVAQYEKMQTSRR
jgi:hypothetical protein